jgi:glutamine synthetase
MDAKQAVSFAQEHDAQMVDFRFTDLPGTWQHFSMPIGEFKESIFEDGLGFDGSSIRGFQAINESDMLLAPDPSTIFMDPFMDVATAVVTCNIEDPITREAYSRDPRYIAMKAEQYLRQTGIADTAFFGPEAEFFLFDNIRYVSESHRAGFEIDSEEGPWQTNSEVRPNLGYKMRPKGGYFPCPPNDRLQDVRTEMALKLIEVGVPVEIHHHEVGAAGQCEIDIRFDEMVVTADKLQKYKYVVKNVAFQYGLTATFMPKPIYGDNGSGMHVHSSLWKNGENMMYDEKGLRRTQRHCSLVRWRNPQARWSPPRSDEPNNEQFTAASCPATKLRSTSSTHSAIAQPAFAFRRTAKARRRSASSSELQTPLATRISRSRES